MKKYIRYLPIATVLLLPFLAPFAGSKAQRDENDRVTRAARVFNPGLVLQDQQDQKAGDGSPVKGRFYGNLDIRLTEPAAAAKLAQKSSSAIAQKAQKHAVGMEKAILQMRRDLPGVDAKISPITGAVEVLRSNSGPLSDFAQGRSGDDIVRSFIRGNSELYGLGRTDIANLKFLGESVSPASGMRMVRVEQTVNGLPVFQSETRFILDRDGRVFRSTGLMVPNATSSTPALDVNQLISAGQALVQAMASVDITVSAAEERLITSDGEGPTKTEVVANNEKISGNVPSKLVYFPIAPGVLIPAWSQITFTSGIGDWYTLVDAKTGKLLWRKNIRDNASTHQARFSVYVQADGKTPADSPAPNSPSTALTGGGTQFPEILRTTVSMLTVQDIVASPNGWLNDCPGGICTVAETQTIGNNVHAYLDRSAPNNVPDTAVGSALDGNGKPTGNPDTFGRNRDFLGAAPRDFNYTPAPLGGNPEAGTTPTGTGNAAATTPQDIFRRGAITQLFYVSNWYHDQLFQLGFDEAAGNFQETNFSGMGVGSDRVLAEAQDVTGTNNANFSTPPDGVEGRAQMYRFTGPTIDRDGDLDAEILVHELTHGTSNRLIGNGSGLNWDVGGGMGEGWSDFYALSLLNNTNADDPNARYSTGAYATYKFFFPSISPAYLDNYVYGIRRFPYSTDNTVNPLTWADVDDVTNNLSGGIAPDPLDNNFAGGFEVHNIGEVWALTLWEVRSRIIAANGGNVPTGNQITLQLVTDAMKMTPANPTFIAGRDALIDADCVTNACANEQSIWDGFADRGLGYKASAPLAQMFGYVAGHMGITESFSSPDLDVQTVTVDDSSGNNNGAIDPGEPIKLTVSLNNPWRNASKNVASATATLTSSTPGIVIYDGNSAYPAIAAQGTAAGDTFLFTVPTSAICGQSIKFTLTPNSTLGAASAREIILRVGAPSGTGAPVTYTRSLVALAVPDFTPRGVFDSLNVTDDFEIADLNFRVDMLTHTFPGDLSVMLKAPNGYGGDLISVIGGLIDGGPGDNMINTLVDDTAVAPNDFLVATSAQAPYTDDWLPIFNAPSWTLAGFPPPDAVGQLSRLNGTSTQGTWRVLLSDQIGGDIGTLNGWSLIVTPRAFACVAFTPVSNVFGTKTVSGTFTPGGSITYTVTLTNNGSGLQADNPGNEFTDILPAQLTLVSASATSGTAGANTGTNTVSWNGSLAPLGGSVTITINATIKNTTLDGTTVSNQGTISYDGDGNGTNESTRLTDDPSVGGASDPTNFTVSDFNDPPDAMDDVLSNVTENSGVRTIPIATLLANDNAGPNESGQTLTFSLVAGSEVGGTVTTDGTNVYFTPTPNYNGPASFQYRITDNGTSNGVPDPKSDTATVSWSIGEVNQAPTANNDPLGTVAEDSGQRIIQFSTLLSNDSKGPPNESGQTLTVNSVSNPVGGTVSIVGNTVRFNLTPNFHGQASFKYTAQDNGTTNGVPDPKTSAPATAGFNVTPVADTPSVTNATTNANTQTTSGLVISRNPVDGAEVTHFKITGITGGLLFKNDGTTPINNGDFITFAEGNAGLKFTAGTTNGSFNVQASTSASDAGLGGGTTTATITVNPLGGVIRFSAANYSVAESAGFRVITVERTGDTTQAVTVDYASSDHSNPADSIPCSSPGAGFASSRCDFTTAIGRLRFAAGETSKTFNVLISQDNYVEGTETLSLTLSNPTGGAALGTPAGAVLEITDDLSEPAANPIDTSSDFVRALYHDLLNREPDAPGLAFWTDNIEKCNDPARLPAGQTVAQCIDKQRESTAIAFFMSPELQMTGGFVYRLYKGSLTGTPNYDGGSAGRFPTFVEFINDVSQVSEGIVVGNQISGAVVEANRNRLASEFVLRPEFLAKYGGLNNSLYVQELFNTTGIAATAGEKQALVDGLENGTESRASVLRKVVDGTVVISESNVQFTTPYGQAFINQEARRLFVFMEYAGFLRRNPDTAGFVFWLGKLNQFNGDPFQAEMVRAFILSPEYRSRFGQP